jgi:hypothetical protein
MERCEYWGQKECLRLANGAVEAVVATAIGPRILHYSLSGGRNILGRAPSTRFTSALGEWRLHGGHRLWTAPESIPASYEPDDDPVIVEERGGLSVRLVRAPRPDVGIEKAVTVTMENAGTGLAIMHEIVNRGIWPVEIAPWGLTVMAGGGTAIIPQEPFRSHDDYVQPARPVVFWHYTDLSDPRWNIGPGFIRLRCDASRPEPQKIGAGNRQGWAGYAKDGLFFLKRFPWDASAAYPDWGCNCEIYTAGDFIEVESLGPLRRLEPGQGIQYEERWNLHEGPVLEGTDGEIAEKLRPILPR